MNYNNEFKKETISLISKMYTINVYNLIFVFLLPNALFVCKIFSMLNEHLIYYKVPMIYILLGQSSKPNWC